MRLHRRRPEPAPGQPIGSAAAWNPRRSTRRPAGWICSHRAPLAGPPRLDSAGGRSQHQGQPIGSAAAWNPRRSIRRPAGWICSHRAPLAGPPRRAAAWMQANRDPHPPHRGRNLSREKAARPRPEPFARTVKIGAFLVFWPGWPVSHHAHAHAQAKKAAAGPPFSPQI